MICGGGSLKKTLLVTNSEQSAAALSKLLEEEGYKDITVSYAAYSAEQQEEEFDFVCINAPLADENGIALATRFANTTRASVVIIVPKASADQVSDMLNEKGVLVISKPINRHLFHHYLLFADCFRSRLLRVEQENDKLKSRRWICRPASLPSQNRSSEPIRTDIKRQFRGEFIRPF